MHRVDTQKPGTPLRIGPPPLPDGDRAGLGRLPLRRQFPVMRTAPEIVQVRYRNLRQAGMLGFAELRVLPFEDMHRRRPAEPFVSPVHGGQQLDIPGRVLGRKSSAPIGYSFDHAVFAVLANQSAQLRQAAPRELAQPGANPAALLFALCRVLLSDQYALHKAVQLAPISGGEFDRLTAFEKFLDL